MSETPHDTLTPTEPAQLRRSSSDRVIAGVAGGLAEYFGVDPVLFRVLFGVSAFFGGVGVVGYLLAWALVPEPGSTRSAFDGAAAWFARRGIPLWLPIAVAVAVAWIAVFSWWSPWPSAPIAVVAVLLIIALQRNRNRAGRPTGYPASPDATAPEPNSPDPASSNAASSNAASSNAASSNAASPDAASPDAGTLETALPTDDSSLAGGPEIAPRGVEVPTRQGQRRRRARPMLLGTYLTLGVTLSVLAICDAASGIRLPVYFWVVVGLTLAGLVVGIALRRTPWSLVLLLPWPVIGLIAFGDTAASLHDGAGQRLWAPTSAAALDSSYRQCFGKVVLDLRGVPPLSQVRTVDITVAAGDVTVIVPRTLNAIVRSEVRFGAVKLDDASTGNSGAGLNVELPAPAGATGAPLTVNVRLADGQVAVRHG